MPLYRTDPGAVYGRAQSALQIAGNTMSQQTKKTTKKTEVNPGSQVANYAMSGVGMGLTGLAAYEKFDKYFGNGKNAANQTPAMQGAQQQAMHAPGTYEYKMAQEGMKPEVEMGAEGWSPGKYGAQLQRQSLPLEEPAQPVAGSYGEPPSGAFGQANMQHPINQPPTNPAGGPQGMQGMAGNPPKPGPQSPLATGGPAPQAPAGGIAPKTPTGNPVKNPSGNLGTVNQSDAGPANAAQAFETNVGRDQVAKLPGMESTVADQSLNAGGNLGQAGHIKPAVFPGVSHRDRTQGFFRIKHPDAGVRKIVFRPVPFRQIQYRLPQAFRRPFRHGFPNLSFLMVRIRQTLLSMRPSSSVPSSAARTTPSKAS